MTSRPTTESTGSLRSLIGDSCSRCELVDNSTRRVELCRYKRALKHNSKTGRHFCFSSWIITSAEANLPTLANSTICCSVEIISRQTDIFCELAELSWGMCGGSTRHLVSVWRMCAARRLQCRQVPVPRRSTPSSESSPVCSRYVLLSLPSSAFSSGTALIGGFRAGWPRVCRR